jgi:diguanylate cyclase (GGDEF)-like protein
MRRDELSRIGPADEAQTPPASVPQHFSVSERICPLFQRPRPLFERSLAGQSAAADEQAALGRVDPAAAPPAALEPFLGDAAALLRQAFTGPDGRVLGGAARRNGDGFALAAETIAKLLRSVEASRHAALHDPLTGLANRSLILDHLQLALARAGRRSALAAVIFVDLDDFKQINDTWGHLAGDELLVRVADRLRPAVRPADTLGRWGGDEFVVVCEDLERASDAPAIVARVRAAFEVPFDVGDSQLRVTASIGVAVSAGTDQPATLIHAADSAMYRAKRDHPTRSQTGLRLAEFPIGAGVSKHERLARRLHEVLSSLEVDDGPLSDQAASPADVF